MVMTRSCRPARGVIEHSANLRWLPSSRKVSAGFFGILRQIRAISSSSSLRRSSLHPLAWFLSEIDDPFQGQPHPLVEVVLVELLLGAQASQGVDALVYPFQQPLYTLIDDLMVVYNDPAIGHVIHESEKHKLLLPFLHLIIVALGLLQVFLRQGPPALASRNLAASGFFSLSSGQMR